MRCSICGIQIDSLEEAAEEGWEPYFYDGETEYELACPGCAEAFLHEGEHGEMELKEEYRGKLKYMAERGDEAGQDHLLIGIAVSDNVPGKLN